MGVWEVGVMGLNFVYSNGLGKMDIFLSFFLEERLIVLYLFRYVFEDCIELVINLVDVKFFVDGIFFYFFIILGRRNI